jgi:hypothetical protein
VDHERLRELLRHKVRRSIKPERLDKKEYERLRELLRHKVRRSIKPE